jgi:hypothetical protein
VEFAAVRVRKHAMPRATAALYCVLFVAGVLTAAWAISDGTGWPMFVRAAASILLVTTPCYAWWQYRYAAAMQLDYDSGLRAQMISGNETLRIARERDRERMAAQSDAWNRAYAALALENRQLRIVRPSRDTVTGRFVKAQPAALLLTNRTD